MQTKDGVINTYVDEGVNASIFHHFKRVRSRRNICFAIQRDMAKGVFVQELKGPIEQGYQAAQHAKECHANEPSNATLVTSLLPGNRAQLTQQLYNGHQQTSKADTSKGIGESSLGGPARGSFGKVAATTREEPGSVDSCNRRVNHVLDNFTEPVETERGEDYQSNDFAFAATAAVGATFGVVPIRFVRDVNGR